MMIFIISELRRRCWGLDDKSIESRIQEKRHDIRYLLQQFLDCLCQVSSGISRLCLNTVERREIKHTIVRVPFICATMTIHGKNQNVWRSRPS